MKAGRRVIRSGRQFDHLFPEVKGKNVLKLEDAELKDTIDLMQKVISDTRVDTAELAHLLKAQTLKQTCRNIWDFSFNHLQYQKDKKGTEQVRRPARSWRDRVSGVDCDCMTVFIASLLVNLGIDYTIRLTRMESNSFEHVYPVVKYNDKTIILDVVVHKFNREAPYKEKKDIDMKLEYLNGVGDDFDQEDFDIFENDLPIDAQGLLREDQLEGLEGRAERLARRAKRKQKRVVRRQTPLKQRVGTAFRKGLNVINKVNPATALLRAGLLAAMKLNIGGIASKLRYAYWTESEAVRNNMHPIRFRLLVKIKNKVEKIFFGAGGKPENLKKAIITGKGNSNRKVSLNGLGNVDVYLDDDSELREILGDELYYQELQVDESLSGLGFVATGTALGAASGMIAFIVKLIKKLGGLFKKGTLESKDEEIEMASNAMAERTRTFSLKNLAKLPTLPPQEIPNVNLRDQELSPFDSFDEGFTRKSMDVDIEDDPDKDIKSDDPPKGDNAIITWVKDNKMLVGLGTLGVIGIGALIWRSKTKNKSKPKSKAGLSGVSKKRKVRKSVTRKVKPSARKKTNKKKRKPVKGRKPKKRTRKAIRLGD